MSRFKGWSPEAVAEHRHAQMIARYRDLRWPLPPVPIAGEANAGDKPITKTALEYPLALLCREHGLPPPIPEYKFHPRRRWRADYCWPLRKLIVEIDGSVWTQGRHTRGAGFIEDQRKLNAATLLGFAVLRYTPDRLGECVADLKVMFA